MIIRVTKYDPCFRDSTGRYLKNEWTSPDDIGKTYDEEVFTREKYLSVEKKYVEAIKLLFTSFNCQKIEINALEKWDDKAEVLSNSNDKKYLPLFESLSNGYQLDFGLIEPISILILRNYLWAYLDCVGSKIRVRFGYDYYMYFIIDDITLISIENLSKNICSLGLFVEELEKPAWE